MTAHAFSKAEQAAVYRAIYERRDMRHFSGGSVPDDQLQRLLQAAHHAPSVGLMQHWQFIRVRSQPLRQALHALVEQECVLTAKALDAREDEFMKLKAAPEKQVTTEALNKVKLEPQEIIKGLKLEQQTPESKPATSIVNSLAALWGVALLLGLGAWQQSRRWRLVKIPISV